VADELALLTADVADVGLLRVDDERVIAEANSAAHRHLARREGSLAGRTLLEAFLDHRVADLFEEAKRDGHAQLEMALGGEPQRTLLVDALRIEGDTWILVRDLSELRRLQRIRAEFIDNLSHELRTPLTNVRLLAETLAGEIESADVSDRIRGSVARIDIETGHLATMVTELLDLARIEQGGAVLRRDEVDLRDLVDRVVGRLDVYARQQAVTITSDVSDPRQNSIVVGDEERLEQMLVNLVHNAIKFSPAGGEVAVSVAPESNDDGMLILHVADHGPGIPQHALERVFERFYKVDRARARGEQAGTGLGLSIVRHIAEAHAGRAWAESAEGQGSNFFVALPRG